MERSRGAMRGAVAVMSGGLSRRRQRNSSRDSPDENAGTEMPESARLKDRGGGGEGKIDGDRGRDRSGRSKRRRGEKVLHVSSNLDDDEDEDEESSEDSIDDEDDDVTIRFALPSHPPLSVNPSSSSSPQQQSSNHHHHHHHHHHPHHHHHHQHHSKSQHHQQHQSKSFPPKVFKQSLVWKTDEMIGVAVPRKARSAVKRPHESWVSGGVGGVGGGEQNTRQASTSPSRLNPASTTPFSSSSDNASHRKKMKLIGGNKQRPAKISKAPSSSVIQDDIEIEVAEVLFGMNRQQFCPPKQETHKVDTRELDASVNEARSRVSSPSSILPSPASNPSVLSQSNSTSHPVMPDTAASKRKKPRPVKFDDESHSSAPVEHAGSSMPSAVKLEAGNLIKTAVSSPRSLQNSAPQVGQSGDCAAAEIVPQIGVAQLEAQPEETKLDSSKVSDLKPSTGVLSIKEQIDCKDEASSASEATICENLDNSVKQLSEAATLKKQVADNPRQEKFSIDLMAPPTGKLSANAEDACNLDSDLKPIFPEAEMFQPLKASTTNKDQEMLPVEQAASSDCDMIDKSTSRKQMAKEHAMNLRDDLEKAIKDDLDNGKLQIQKQQQKAPKVEPKLEKAAPSTAMNMPMAVRAWPGGFPLFGYTGQVPSLQGLVPMDGPAGTSNAMQLQPAFFAHQSPQKRCATHYYIAQTIHNYQKIARMNPFWSAAAATNPIHEAKPYVSVMPPSDATLFTNPMHASFPGRNTSSLHDTKISAVGSSASTGHPSTEKKATTSNPMTEVAQRKQIVLQQTPHTGSTTNMLYQHAPAFIFPINQQQAAAVSPNTNRATATKSTPGPGNLVVPSGASSSAAGSPGSSGALTPMNLSFRGFSTGDAQYLAMMQNNPYPYPLPAHIAGASPFRGATPPQAMPYFFPSHMLQPSQIQSPQQLQQQHAGTSHTHAPQNHQKANTSNGSSSSQKHIQQPNLGSGLGVAGTNLHGTPASNQRQKALLQNSRQESVKGSEENTSTSGNRVSQVQKDMQGQSFSITSSTAAAAVVGSGGHGDKKIRSEQPQQKQNVKMDLTSPPAFTMPFTSFSGTGVVLPGLHFSSLSQNHAIFQTLPEAARQGFNQITTAYQGAQNKKSTKDDGRSVVRESVNVTVTAEDDQKAAMADSKSAGGGLQHSLTFSKPGGENNAMDNSSRTLNPIQAPANGSRTVNHPLGGSVSVTTSIPSQQHQQQQQQRQLSSSRSKTSVSTNSSSFHSDPLAGSPTVVKFPQPPTGFPRAVMQDGSLQSQINTSSGRSSAPISSSFSAPPIHKSNHLVHQQARSAQQPLPSQSHQTQISFGMNSVKVVPFSAQHFSGVIDPSAAATPVAPTSNPAYKNGDRGSPRSLTNAKPAPATTGGPHLHQSSSKISPAPSSTSKIFPVGSIPSILGHPQNTAGNSSTKLQQQQQLPQSQKQQPFPQAQLYFTNVYMQQPHPVQSNAATTTAVATGYYQKRQADQATQHIQQQQITSVSGSSGMLALPALGTSTDPAKAMAGAAVGNATNTKAVSQANLLHPSQFTVVHSAAAGSPHALVPATFPHMSKPANSVKVTIDQKPAAGSDNPNACWQPEKRR